MQTNQLNVHRFDSLKYLRRGIVWRKIIEKKTEIKTNEKKKTFENPKRLKE